MFQIDVAKIIAIVTDNGSNMVKSFREFGVSVKLDTPLQVIVHDEDGIDEIEFVPFPEPANEVEAAYTLPV